MTFRLGFLSENTQNSHALLRLLRDLALVGLLFILAEAMRLIAGNGLFKALPADLAFRSLQFRGAACMGGSFGGGMSSYAWLLRVPFGNV